MKGLVVSVVLVTAGIAIGSRLAAQQQLSCLHGPNESSAQRVRARQALLIARQINTLENASFQGAGGYRPLGQLAGLSAVPEGFELHAAIEPLNYAFAVKDMTDPCGFAYFSDDKGVIYTGESLR